MLAYTEDIKILLGDTDVVEVTEKLIKSNHKINFTINENKTKYLVITKHTIKKAAIKVGPYSFEQVSKNNI